MNFEGLFSSESHEVLVKAVYLAGRYLSRSITWDSFVRQLTADVKTDTRRQALAAVKAILEEIERESGRSIAKITASGKSRYVAELDKLLWETVTVNSVDPRETDEILNALRSTQ